MAKNKFIYMALAAATISFSSCEKDFLEKTPTEKLTPQQTSTESLIKGMYAQMYQTGTGGTTGHDDFGQKGYDIYMDLLSGDMALEGVNYGWYENLANLTAPVNFTANPNYTPWRYYYALIFSANSIIDKFEGVAPTAKSDQYAFAQAKATRANAYFYLLNLYSPELYGTGSEKVIPLLTSTSQVNQPKATAKEIFDLITSDLTEAVELLNGFSRSTKGEINQAVAKGMLAYAYAARGTQEDWQKVADLTNQVITSGAYPLTTYSQAAGVLSIEKPSGSEGYWEWDYKVSNSDAGFNNIETASWMWGADIQVSTGLDLVSWWGQMDLFTYSYTWAGDPKGIDADLYDAIRPNDVRKTQFYAEADYLPLGKFFAPDLIIGGQRTITTDYIYMRVDELYLLNAEANAHLGQEAKAIASLKALLAQRFKNAADYAYINTLSGKQLLDEIYLQTRIELWGEGKSYLAMKRNKATVTRGANHLFFEGEPYKYNADELTLDIPQAEIINNPNLNK
ncbi:MULTISPECIES: RagB/SusD family nutrient uptake outer membrane protein [Sphingobacterium]|uniref:RagB/SusD family nutrient uptake outer membrane protein n=1 Tax=Sphingobacterium litopenaei TaxID=2763500 RepID=A0ABR7YA90_9SPHI|nr:MULTISPECIES: RagB/SusD family nutrient uptake outer membrane protein [Sphingobacterium]MBD1428219.1 RagB/SusD family nutrient uptake outer membrane protein [Sphingobacterium litopenaei]